MINAQDYKSGVEPIWCPGCGDYGALQAFTNAVAGIEIDPKNLVIVSGIGCSGRFSHFVKGYGLHVVHGRVLPVAMGIKMANPGLTVFGIAGDGDALAIGGGHIAHMARRNTQVVYIILDNEIYGLTKGQISPTSPETMKTTTTPYGSIEQGVDPIAMFISYDTSFVARGFSGNYRELRDIMTQAVHHRGFSIIHVLSPCPTFNKVMTFTTLRENVVPIPPDHDPSDKKKAMLLALERDRYYTGIFYRREDMTQEDRWVRLREASHGGDFLSLLHSFH